ncbi:hypothetical protein F2Q70_00014439 [Brassica cretica]|uniref:Uncharacterized protein n=1 Tax=Brassica cretica TaxID=69181 RepID=A0A8S9I522_BRACR|nr:hypothetical protein F2Q70_00014439 [Brassica cretica]
MWRIALPSTLFRVMSFGCIVVAQAFIGHNSERGLAAYALLQSTFIRFIYGVMVCQARRRRYVDKPTEHNNIT